MTMKWNYLAPGLVLKDTKSVATPVSIKKIWNALLFDGVCAFSI